MIKESLTNRENCEESPKLEVPLDPNNMQQPLKDGSEKKKKEPNREKRGGCELESLIMNEEESSGRERLKKHRIEVAGRVWIPEIWGQEELLKDWIDCSVFDACLVPNGIISARAALIHEGRRANSVGLRIVKRC